MKIRLPVWCKSNLTTFIHIHHAQSVFVLSIQNKVYIKMKWLHQLVTNTNLNEGKFVCQYACKHALSPSCHLLSFSTSRCREIKWCHKHSNKNKNQWCRWMKQIELFLNFFHIFICLSGIFFLLVSQQMQIKKIPHFQNIKEVSFTSILYCVCLLYALYVHCMHIVCIVVFEILAINTKGCIWCKNRPVLIKCLPNPIQGPLMINLVQSANWSGGPVLTATIGPGP